jgi:Protein of unknown function (DUF4065)
MIRDERKIVECILYVLQKLGGESRFHKVFKILYFADQKHLSRYGVAITHDDYSALPKGPVPSLTYDRLKFLREVEGDTVQGNVFGNVFAKKLIVHNNHFIKTDQTPDLEWFSETEVQVLNESISENKSLGFSTLTEKSHDAAWKKHKYGLMHYVDIAQAATSEEITPYVRLAIENFYGNLS